MVWSILFEVVGPIVLPVTGDLLDVLAYAAGGLISGLWWNRWVVEPTASGLSFDRLARHYRWMETIWQVPSSSEPEPLGCPKLGARAEPCSSGKETVVS